MVDEKKRRKEFAESFMYLEKLCMAEKQKHGFNKNCDCLVTAMTALQLYYGYFGEPADLLEGCD